ncbi:MAG: hypothetical protein CR962_00050 [Gammaproteobacteria bacterium]|nr:MAG: hypothetical protein CR962_00050 [Gammaproteobacteria bacterium]
MKMQPTKPILLLLFSSTLLITAAHAEAPLRIGFVYPGPITDKGWSYRNDQGRLAIKNTFGDAVSTIYVERVVEGDQSKLTLDPLSKDNQLIFAASFGYMDSVMDMAKKYPNVKFEHSGGLKRADNVATYSARFYEGRYIIGMLAGAMTKSNTIGYVAAMPVPQVMRGINATMLGIKAVNPQAKIKII